MLYSTQVFFSGPGQTWSAGRLVATLRDLRRERRWRMATAATSPLPVLPCPDARGGPPRHTPPHAPHGPVRPALAVPRLGGVEARAMGGGAIAGATGRCIAPSFRGWGVERRGSSLPSHFRTRRTRRPEYFRFTAKRQPSQPRALHAEWCLTPGRSPSPPKTAPFATRAPYACSPTAHRRR